MPRLFALSGEDLGRSFDFDRAVVLGRGEAAEVRLRSTSVSRNHARVEPDPGTGGWRIVDLGSRNGVSVGGQRVSSAALEDGGVFKLGELELRFRDEIAPGTGVPIVLTPGAASEAPTAVPRAMSAEATISDGIELEGDWEDVVPPPTVPVRPAAPRPEPTRPAAAGTPSAAQRERDARRTALLRGAGQSVATRGVAPNAGPVLQYHRTEGSAGLFGADLAQRPLWVRTLVWLVGLALMAGLAYGALELTRKLRAGESALSGAEAGVQVDAGEVGAGG